MFERRIFTFRRAATRGATAIFFALALGALLVLRPACFAQAALPAPVVAAQDHAMHAQGGAAGSNQPECCSIHADALLANAGDTASSLAKDAAAAAPAYAGAVLVLFTVFAPRSRSAPGALERTRPYHARSARMLR